MTAFAGGSKGLPIFDLGNGFGVVGNSRCNRCGCRLKSCTAAGIESGWSDMADALFGHGLWQYAVFMLKAKQVQCKGCGFLCVQIDHRSDRYSSAGSMYFRIDNEGRETGKAFTQPKPHDLNDWWAVQPVCFRGHEDIPHRIAAAQTSRGLKGSDDRVKFALEVFAEPRVCAKFTPFIPGMSPEWHLQEVRADELERDRRRFEGKLTAIAIGIGAMSMLASIAAVWLGWVQLQATRHTLEAPPEPVPEFTLPGLPPTE